VTAAGLTGTPSFVLGRSTARGVEGVKIVGAVRGPRTVWMAILTPSII